MAVDTAMALVLMVLTLAVVVAMIGSSVAAVLLGQRIQWWQHCSGGKSGSECRGVSLW